MRSRDKHDLNCCHTPEQFHLRLYICGLLKCLSLQLVFHLSIDHSEMMLRKTSLSKDCSELWIYNLWCILSIHPSTEQKFAGGDEFWAGAVRTMGIYFSESISNYFCEGLVTRQHKKIFSLQGCRYKCNHNWQKLLFLEVESCLIKTKLCSEVEVIISLAILWKGRCDLEVICYSYS